MALNPVPSTPAANLRRAMKPPPRQRLLTIAVLFALAALLLTVGVALALLEGQKFSGALVGSLLAFALIVLLLRTDTELIVRLLGSLQMLGPVLAFTILSTVMGKTAGTLSFDEVSAQVLIVLLLALAVDARFFRLRSGQDRLDVIVVLYTMLLLAVGEFLALRGLLTSHPARAEMIAGAIAAGFTAVAIAALTGTDRDQAEVDSPSTP